MNLKDSCVSKVKARYGKSELISIRKDTNYIRLDETLCELLHDLSLNRRGKTRRGKRGGQKSKTNIGLINAQSVRNKTDILHEYILEQNLDLCCFVETWLKENDDWLIKQLTPNGFDILHHDRKGKTGGGVAVLFKTEYKARLENFPDYSSFEYISIVLQPLDLRVCSIYRPPSIDGISAGTFFNDIAELFEILVVDKKKIIIAG